jgi:hypothetical protein
MRVHILHLATKVVGSALGGGLFGGSQLRLPTTRITPAPFACRQKKKREEGLLQPEMRGVEVIARLQTLSVSCPEQHCYIRKADKQTVPATALNQT